MRSRPLGSFVIVALAALITVQEDRSFAHPYYAQLLNEDCSVCHGNNAAMSTTPANGGTLSFFKTLIGRSTTASFTVSDTSTITANPPPQGGGGFTGSFPAAAAPFSPTTSTGFITTPPANATAGYTYILPPAVVTADGGQSSISQIYTFTPTTRGAFSKSITFTPSAGGFMGFPSGTFPSSTITLSGTGVAPVISLTTSAAAAGNIRIGTTGTASITIKDIGDGNQAGAGLGNLTGTITSGSGGFTGSGGSFNLADSASQNFNYTFSPTLHASGSAAITINATNGNSNGTNTAQTLSATLSATGVGPTLSTGLASGGTLNFGKAVSPQQPSQSTSVSNITADANLGTLTNLDIVSATLSGTGASMFSLSGVGSGTTLAKSQSGNLTVTFVPSIGFTGSATAVLTLITDEGAANGAIGKTATYTVTGLGAMEAYWKGGHGGNWNTTSPGYDWVVANGSTTEVNWLPTASADVFFTDPNPATTNTSLGQNLSVKSVTFSASSAPMTIGGSNTLTIFNGLTVSGGSASHTISAPVQLSGSETWAINSSGTLTDSGPISGAATLIKTGSGRLVLSGSNTFSGGIDVAAGSLIVTSPTALANGSNLLVGANATSLDAIVPGVPAQASFVGSANSAVPEPGTFALVAIVAAVAFGGFLATRPFMRWRYGHISGP
jgi:autotransporter-associated beta strand protein